MGKACLGRYCSVVRVSSVKYIFIEYRVDKVRILRRLTSSIHDSAAPFPLLFLLHARLLRGFYASVSFQLR